MKNVNVNGVDYSGVSQVQLKTTSGGTALFKDVDEIVTPSGVKTITENGTYDVTNFATLVANIAASGGGGLTNISTGTAKPEAVNKLYIPVEAGKKVAAIMTWCDAAFRDGGCTCGHIVISGFYYLNGIKDTLGFAMVKHPENGSIDCALYNKAEGSAYDAEKGYLLDRKGSSEPLRDTDTFNYIVFYTPVGDLSFGGA